MRSSGEDAPLRGRRIVFVLAWSVLGGAERDALSTAAHLAEAGATVSVLALTGESGRARDLFASLGVSWHAQPTDWHGTRPRKVVQLVALAARLRALRPDVLLPYTSRPNVLCGLIWRATGASLCVWNQQDLIRAAKFGRRVTSRAVRQTPLFIANSEPAREFLVTELGARRERVHVVLDRAAPIDVDGIRHKARRQLGIEPAVPVVSMLAHLHGGKDHETLLRAWSIVLETSRDPAPVLLLAGRPSGTAEAVKALAFDLELGRSVRFLGDAEDVEAVLAASDIAVLSSRSESRPHALLESAAAGLPIAGTDVPGIRAAVGAHQFPYLAPTGDANALAQALVRLISDQELRAELGGENRRLAVESAAGSGPTVAELITQALTVRRSAGERRALAGRGGKPRSRVRRRR